MGLLMEFNLVGAALVGVFCLINMKEGKFNDDKEYFKAGKNKVMEKWFDPEIQHTKVSSSIGLSFLFSFLRCISSPKASSSS